jgi:hypothetical protein
MAGFWGTIYLYFNSSGQLCCASAANPRNTLLENV